MITLLTTLVLTAASPTPTDQQLKEEFLRCDYNSREYVLDDGEAAYCSEIYEQLKKQVFNNDYPALQRWWLDATKPQR